MPTRYLALFCLISLLIIIFGGGCACGPEYPPEVTEALDKAGQNRGQLVKVLEHYRAKGDSLEYLAAGWLIGNMPSHFYGTYVLQDTTGAEINFSIFDYPDYASLTQSFDSLEKRYGTLDFQAKGKIYDVETISAELLIDHIDYAFRVWHEKPWARWVSFDEFCNYILPYRGSNEPLENWRPVFWGRYLTLQNGMTDSTDATEAAVKINNDIMSWFGFDPRYYYHPTDQGMTEMIKNRLGRCEDMTNLTIFAMRANGLAVTSDYTPAWADAGNNHAWNAILIPGGKVVPFMGAEANPGSYGLANKFAKVYRKMFSEQKNNLAFQDKKQTELPGWLAGKSYIDVTGDYQEVCDVTVPFDKPIPDSVDIAYLCVFNSGEWKAIHWGRIENGKVVFTDMGKEIAYLPALYLNKKFVPYGPPFILGADCALRELRPDSGRTTSVQVAATTGRVQAASTDGIAKSFLTPGKEYELFYMADDWKSLGKAVAGDKPLVFENVPMGSLLWLVETNSDREERIFTYDNDRQIWW